jgi:hypothetical protein
MSKKVTARKEREPTVFRIGMSLLNEKVFAGYARGLQFIGNKKDVTQSFFLTVTDWFKKHELKSGVSEIVLDNGDSIWNIKVRKLKKPVASRRKKK